MKLLTFKPDLPSKSSKILSMKSLFRIGLMALLALQVIAMPLHAFSEGMQHLVGGSSHHHHAHTGSDAADAHNHHSADDSASELTAESGEHSCISHCHAPAALLDDTVLFKQVPMHFSAVSQHFGLAQNLPNPIDRPQWSAARV